MWVNEQTNKEPLHVWIWEIGLLFSKYPFPNPPPFPLSHCHGSSMLLFPIDNGLGHVTCYDQWSICRCPSSKGLKCACTVGLGLLHFCCHENNSLLIAANSRKMRSTNSGPDLQLGTNPCRNQPTAESHRTNVYVSKKAVLIIACCWFVGCFVTQ